MQDRSPILSVLNFGYASKEELCLRFVGGFPIFMIACLLVTYLSDTNIPCVDCFLGFVIASSNI
jgi:hypothetical protein